MLDPTKIPLGRLAVAYGLSSNEIDGVIEDLGATYDYEWVRREYDFVYPGLELFINYDAQSLKELISGLPRP